VSPGDSPGLEIVGSLLQDSTGKMRQLLYVRRCWQVAPSCTCAAHAHVRSHPRLFLPPARLLHPAADRKELDHHLCTESLFTSTMGPPVAPCPRAAPWVSNRVGRGPNILALPIAAVDCGTCLRPRYMEIAV
jgi:hypothetical protein